jgi:hypothetical protein
MSTKYPDLFAALAARFEKSEVKALNVKGRQMQYITARTAMNRLDQVLGPENWWDEYLPGEDSVRCQLTIRLPDGATLTKYDAGGYAGMQDQGDDDKSGYSDAFKRACVKFGVGRYLYGDGVPRYQTNGAARSETGAGGRRPADGRRAAEPSGSGTSGRAAVNATFPSRTSPPEQRQETWAAWIAKRVQAENQEYRNHQQIEGVAKIEELANQNQMVNYLGSLLVAQRIISEEEILDLNGKRDRSKTLEHVSGYFGLYPDWVKERVEEHMVELWARECARKGIINPRAPEDTSAQDGVEHASQETPGGREPGEDG